LVFGGDFGQHQDLQSKEFLLWQMIYQKSFFAL
jgi:hypothetical protein